MFHSAWHFMCHLTSPEGWHQNDPLSENQQTPNLSCFPEVASNIARGNFVQFDKCYFKLLVTFEFLFLHTEGSECSLRWIPVFWLNGNSCAAAHVFILNRVNGQKVAVMQKTTKVNCSDMHIFHWRTGVFQICNPSFWPWSLLKDEKPCRQQSTFSLVCCFCPCLSSAWNTNLFACRTLNHSLYCCGVRWRCPLGDWIHPGVSHAGKKQRVTPEA